MQNIFKYSRFTTIGDNVGIRNKVEASRGKEHQIDITGLTIYLKAEARAMEAEEKMRQAAEFGKDLLEKNIEMGSELDVIKQEKHELSLKLQVNDLSYVLENQEIVFRPS